MSTKVDHRTDRRTIFYSILFKPRGNAVRRFLIQYNSLSTLRFRIETESEGERSSHLILNDLKSELFFHGCVPMRIVTIEIKIDELAFITFLDLIKMFIPSHISRT